MKSRMLLMLLIFCFVVPSAAQAATKVLLLDDIGAGEVTFAFVKDHSGGVALTARVSQPCWDYDCEPYQYHSTGLLKGFSRQGSEVFYNGGGAPVPCGTTHGIIHRSEILSTCQVQVVPELVCSAWFKEDDCASTTTKHRVYLTM